MGALHRLCSGYAARPKDTSTFPVQPLGWMPALQATGLHDIQAWRSSPMTGLQMGFFVTRVKRTIRLLWVLVLEELCKCLEKFGHVKLAEIPSTTTHHSLNFRTGFSACFRKAFLASDRSSQWTKPFDHFLHHDSFYMLPETIEKGNQLQFVASTGNQQSHTVPSSNLSLSSPSCAAYSVANQTQQPKALNASHMSLSKPKLHEARPW